MSPDRGKALGQHGCPRFRVFKLHGKLTLGRDPGREQVPNVQQVDLPRRTRQRANSYGVLLACRVLRTSSDGMGYGFGVISAHGYWIWLLKMIRTIGTSPGSN